MRRTGRRLKYLLMAVLLIIALVVIIRLVLPEKEDPQSNQVYIDTGTGMAWMTPYDNVPASDLTADDFILVNDQPVYQGSAYRTEIGIDVSEHQYEVDWEKVAQSVDFAYIRLGYRGNTEGGLFLDPWYERNIAGSNAAGLDTGVYFYSQAINVGEAIEEAEFVIEHLRGRRVNLPVIFDWETEKGSGTRTDTWDKQTLTDCAVAFCQTLKNAGYDSGLYFNRRIGYYGHDLGELSDYGYDLSRLTDYCFWVAVPGAWPDYYYACEFWQYSYIASVPGVEGDVDMNMRFIPVSTGSQ